MSDKPVGSKDQRAGRIKRHRLCSRCFLCLSLVNLPLLASLEERFTYGEFGCFLKAGDEDGLEKNDLADKATSDVFSLLWEAVALPAVEALPCFQK